MLLLSVLVASALAPSEALAFSRGVSFNGCTGCHGSGSHTVSVTMTPTTLSPGETGTVRVSVRGSGSVVGLYAAIDTGSVGLVSGGGLQRVDGGATHDGPRAVSGGAASFELRWTAPSTPGAVRFDFSTVMGNGNGRSSGDGAIDSSAFDFVYGCEPATFYRDFDGDGHGREGTARQFCAGAPPPGYAAAADDCSDFDERAFPGASDVCNGRDDDCDGSIDEGAPAVTHYPDADGDGYYSADERDSGESFFGCDSMTGRWASEAGDCAPTDPTRNPGAEDVCNGFDDDCDFRVDERVRPRCGQGWCRRESFTCAIEDCVEGEPRGETCNFFDDDCDGAIDEDTCPAGQECSEAGACVPGGSGPSSDAGPARFDGSAADGGAWPPPRSGGCVVSRAPHAGSLTRCWLLGLALLVLVRRFRRTAPRAGPRVRATRDTRPGRRAARP